MAIFFKCVNIEELYFKKTKGRRQLYFLNFIRLFILDKKIDGRQTIGRSDPTKTPSFLS